MIGKTSSKKEVGTSSIPPSPYSSLYVWTSALFSALSKEEYFVVGMLVQLFLPPYSQQYVRIRGSCISLSDIIMYRICLKTGKCQERQVDNLGYVDDELVMQYILPKTVCISTESNWSSIIMYINIVFLSYVDLFRLSLWPVHTF